MDLVGVSGLQEQLRAFSRARDWEQFHRPKNLAMAIAGEAGELAAVLQWLDSWVMAMVRPVVMVRGRWVRICRWSTWVRGGPLWRSAPASPTRVRCSTTAV